MIRTHEGAVAHEHSLDHGVEFFSKAGSLFDNERMRSFYGSEETALGLFQKIWIVDQVLAMKLVMWLRDCRGGAGNRSGAKAIFKWLGERNAHLMRKNLVQLPDLGRWDDLRSLFGTPLERDAAGFWAAALFNKDQLAAKWADRSDFPVLARMREAGLVKDIGDFRRLLAQIRKDGIVEHKMCHQRWNMIDYEQVPSVAMARYTKAFQKHDAERFERFKEALVSGEAKVHAGVLFPHDCVRTVRHGDRTVAEAQFDALPNYMEDTNERVIVIADTSGSMDVAVSGSIYRVHISQGLALYCSAKIEKDNPFHKKFIAFCNEGKLQDWNGMSFADAVFDRKIFDRAVGSTRIDKALDLILNTARFFNLTDEHIPTTLLIVSDMQFHQGTTDYYHFDHDSEENVEAVPEVRRALSKWKDSGYTAPKVVYWNVAGYAGQPETVEGTDIALVSGFSPAILKSIFDGTDLSPAGVMMRALEKYKVYE